MSRVPNEPAPEAPEKGSSTMTKMTKMMTKMKITKITKMNRLLAGVALLALCAPIEQTMLRAQPLAVAVAERYDTTKIVTLKGTVMLSWYPAGLVPACLMIETAGAGGKPERWIVAGHPPRVLQRTGWRPDAVRGAAVSISVYLPKPGSNAAAALADALVANAPPNAAPDGLVQELRKKDTRHAYGVEVTLPDATTLAFGEKH